MLDAAIGNNAAALALKAKIGAKEKDLRASGAVKFGEHVVIGIHGQHKQQELVHFKGKSLTGTSGGFSAVYYGLGNGFVKSAGLTVDAYRGGGQSHIASSTAVTESDFTIDTPTTIESYHTVNTTTTSTSLIGSHGYQARGMLTVGVDNISADLAAGIEHNSLNGNRSMAEVKLNRYGKTNKQTIGYAHTAGANTVFAEYTQNLKAQWALTLGANHRSNPDDTRIYLGLAHTFGALTYTMPNYNIADARSLAVSTLQTDIL